MPNENWLTDPQQVSPFDITVPDLPVLQRWPPVQQNFRRRETLPTWVSILLIFLAIALIGGGLGLILFATTAQYRRTACSGNGYSPFNSTGAQYCTGTRPGDC